jgi:hypothetical protein
MLFKFPVTKKSYNFLCTNHYQRQCKLFSKDAFHSPYLLALIIDKSPTFNFIIFFLNLIATLITIIMITNELIIKYIDFVSVREKHSEENLLFQEL